MPLALHFLKLSGRGAMKLSTSARNALIAYEWPGNVRELQRAMERVSVFCDGNELQLTDLPAAILSAAANAADSPAKLDDWASRYARIVYEQCGRNKRAACQILGITHHTLTRRLASLATAKLSLATRS